MKIYTLVATREQHFGNGNRLIFEDQYLGTFLTLEEAKRAIDEDVTDDFRKTMQDPRPNRTNCEFYARYEDRYGCGDINAYYILSKDFYAQELKENEDLKKTVKDLTKKVDDLKTRINSLTGSKTVTYTEEIIKPKKEEKSNVKFW